MSEVMEKKPEAAPEETRTPQKEAKAVPETVSTVPASAGAVWHPLAGLRDEIDRVFDDFSRGWFRFSWPGRFELPAFPRLDATGGMLPKCEIAEDEAAYRFTIELPGLDENAVAVSVDEDVLTVEADNKEEKTERTEAYHLSERQYGIYRRSFRLPTNVDVEKISAAMVNGVLTVTAPKLAEVKSEARKIAIVPK